MPTGVGKKRKKTAAKFASTMQPPPIPYHPPTLGEQALSYTIGSDKWLPSTWQHAINTPISQRVKSDPESTWLGRYVTNAGNFYKMGYIDMQREGVDRGIMPHEYAHAAYRWDLSPDMRARWNKLTQGLTMASPRAELPDRLLVYLNIHPLLNYKLYPSEGFTEAFSEYVQDPNRLKAALPAVYKYFKDLIGIDYGAPMRSQ